MNRTRK